jgi:hypothetical protein
MRRYGEAPNGAMAAAPPRNMRRYAMAAEPPRNMTVENLPLQRNPINYGRRPRLVRTNTFNRGRVVPVDPRDVIMDDIQYEHNYARNEQQYRDAVSMLVTAFITRTNEDYVMRREKWSTMSPSFMNDVIQSFFRVHNYAVDPNDPLNVNKNFDSLIGVIRRTFGLTHEPIRISYEYLRGLTLEERTEILNDLNIILQNFTNTLAQQERNRNARGSNVNITGGKRKSRRIKRTKKNRR